MHVLLCSACALTSKCTHQGCVVLAAITISTNTTSITAAAVLYRSVALLTQPDSGRLEAYRPPGGPGIRLDSAVTAGNVISRYYDSLLSKVIASAPTFDKAVQRMARALQEFQVRGIKTNIPFMENVLRHPVFLAGAATTGFIETYNKELFKFEGHPNVRANKLLIYLADMVRSDRTAHCCVAGLLGS
jgi:pyruvate carboxylase